MKLKTSRFIAVLLAAVMLVAALPISALAVNHSDEFNVVISMEGLTLGQGLYVKPKSYTLDEINTLLAKENYGPYAEDELTAGMATLAMLIDNGLEYHITGSWESDAYISEIADIDKGSVDIPSVITQNGGPGNNDHDGNSDKWLGEFDYSFMSGWMITVNDLMIPVGSSQFGLEDNNGSSGYQDYGNTYVIRWQFTLWGYGADLGHNNGWGSAAYYEHANKDMLYAAYADSNNAAAKASALKVMENLTATQNEVDAAIELLNNTSSENTGREAQSVKAVLNATLAQLAASIPAPVFGTTAGEWTVLSLARGGYYDTDSAYFNDYYSRIVETVQSTADSNGALHRVKSTENSRLILALASIGKDPTNVGGVNLVTPFDDFSWIPKQGINGPIFALIALDTQNYQTTDSTIRQQCVDYILNKQLADGGWALSGTAADPDITAMALQALVNYRGQATVAEAAEKGFGCLSAMQKDNGGFASWGSINSESIAQVIVACTAWGINPDTDSRFVKNGHSAVDALLEFYIEEDAVFCHTMNGGSNAMATDQAAYALVAYDRLLNNKNSLYDMTDVTKQASASKDIAATLSLPEKIGNTDGTSFNAIIDLTAWDAKAGYKLMDCIVSVPSELSVTDVTVGGRVSGGQLSYHLEESTGKLRIVYFDPQNGNDIAISGSSYPAEFLVIGFELNKDINIAITDRLSVAVTGMTLKKNSQPDNADSMTIVDITNASDNVKIVKGISYTAMVLYTGDDVDLISSNQTAIAIAVTGVNDGVKIKFNDGTNSIFPRYSASISAKTGVSTYVCMTTSSNLSAFAKASNYTIYDSTADSITFGDSNGDDIINAQDALASVNMWLRKTDAPSGDEILSMNVNSDTRLNTFDALGIVEYFVNGDELAVVDKAATLRNVID